MKSKIVLQLIISLVFMLLLSASSVLATTYCNGNFDSDKDVDGSDAFTFKQDFGRNSYENPCTDANPCNGDFLCDGDVDGDDAFTFTEDFGRNSYTNPYPNCVTDPWCSY